MGKSRMMRKPFANSFNKIFIWNNTCKPAMDKVLPYDEQIADHGFPFYIQKIIQKYIHHYIHNSINNKFNAGLNYSIFNFMNEAFIVHFHKNTMLAVKKL